MPKTLNPKTLNPEGRENKHLRTASLETQPLYPTTSTSAIAYRTVGRGGGEIIYETVARLEVTYP